MYVKPTTGLDKPVRHIHSTPEFEPVSFVSQRKENAAASENAPGKTPNDNQDSAPTPLQNTHGNAEPHRS
jgi:hypothetical protein